MAALARDLRRLPNLLSLARIVLIVLGGFLYFYVSTILGIVVAVIGGLTDYVDGAIARATGQVTRMGAILDQFGDLCFESMALLVAVAQGFFSPLVLFAYLFREFWVTCIRRFLADERTDVPSSIWGKLKTNFLMWGMLPAFLSISRTVPALEPHLSRLAYVGVGLGLVFSYLSAVGYTRAFVAEYERRVR